jgi:hypothetical protein
VATVSSLPFHAWRIRSTLPGNLFLRAEPTHDYWEELSYRLSSVVTPLMTSVVSYCDQTAQKDVGRVLAVDERPPHGAFPSMGLGQHLPDLGNSFHVLPVALAPGEPVQITVDYSNIIYISDPGSDGYPDMDGCTLFLYLIPMGIAVDSNRDGTIAFSGEARDTTSQHAPFRFWINDDDDHVDVEENDRVPVLQPDHLDDQIEGRRELEGQRGRSYKINVENL